MAKVQEEIEHLCKIYSSNHCNTVLVASILCSITAMAPAHLIGCGIVCAEGMLCHYPYSVGQEDQRH